MLVSREVAENHLIKKCEALEDRKEVFDNVEAQYGIPVDVVSDLITFKRDPSEFNDFTLFAVLDVIDPVYVNRYYTADEITEFRATKYEIESFKLPLVFKNMAQVAPDQWIGAISAKQLMELKEAQIIRYNENTQRTLKRIIRGENRYYRIYLNKKSVGEIRSSMESGTYIPDDITLNMPVETTDFTFNNGELKITNMQGLDIIDGYHRYISLSQASTLNKDFDYPMELRIVNFTEGKARQFIFQKDQKTLMRRVESNSLNQYSPENVVVERLNADQLCDIHGMIGRNGANIDYSYLAMLIHYYYFREKPNYSNRDIMEVTNYLKKCFNEFMSQNPEYLDHIFNLRELHALMNGFSYTDDPAGKAAKLLDHVYELETNLFALTTNANLVRRKLINEFKHILETENNDV